jgi:hypothetical protein
METISKPIKLTSMTAAQRIRSFEPYEFANH